MAGLLSGAAGRRGQFTRPEPPPAAERFGFMTRGNATKPPPAPKPDQAPKPAEEIRRHDPDAPDEEEHQQVSRRDLEKGRPTNTGRAGA